jgi:hypothetical protein
MDKLLEDKISIFSSEYENHYYYIEEGTKLLS